MHLQGSPTMRVAARETIGSRHRSAQANTIILARRISTPMLITCTPNSLMSSHVSSASTSFKWLIAMRSSENGGDSAAREIKSVMDVLNGTASFDTMQISLKTNDKKHSQIWFERIQILDFLLFVLPASVVWEFGRALVYWNSWIDTWNRDENIWVTMTTVLILKNLTILWY